MEQKTRKKTYLTTELMSGVNSVAEEDKKEDDMGFGLTKDDL